MQISSTMNVSSELTWRALISVCQQNTWNESSFFPLISSWNQRVSKRGKKVHTIRVNIYSIKMQMESKHAIVKLVYRLMEKNGRNQIESISWIVLLSEQYFSVNQLKAPKLLILNYWNHQSAGNHFRLVNRYQILFIFFNFDTEISHVPKVASNDSWWIDFVNLNSKGV